MSAGNKSGVKFLLMASVNAPSLKLGLGYVPERTPPAGPTGFASSAVKA